MNRLLVLFSHLYWGYTLCVCCIKPLTEGRHLSVQSLNFCGPLVKGAAQPCKLRQVCFRLLAPVEFRSSLQLNFKFLLQKHKSLLNDVGLGLTPLIFLSGRAGLSHCHLLVYTDSVVLCQQRGESSISSLLLFEFMFCSSEAFRILYIHVGWFFFLFVHMCKSVLKL